MRLNASNNAQSVLTQAISETYTLITVEDTSTFPELPFLLTIEEDEILKVTEVDGNNLTVERAQEGTIAKEWDIGSVVENTFTAGMYDGLVSTDKFNEHEITTAQRFNTVHRHNTAQDKEIAYLKLKQEASDRIENGTTFADDFLGNRFGMTFNESESENVILRDGGLIMAEGSMQEITVEDATVVNQAYDTSGNGGRKLVRLDNGWLVAGLKDGTRIHLYHSKDNGESWNLTISYNQAALTDFSISKKGNNAYILAGYTAGARVFRWDYNTSNSSNEGIIDQSQTALGNVSLTINEQGTELHAAWASKNSTYPNGFNIRYAKGIISEIDGSVTWSAVEQITNNNTNGQDRTNPCIIMVKEYPMIFYQYGGSGTTARHIYSHAYDGFSWDSNIVYNGGNNRDQSSPSAIFVPPEINGLPQGRIWVAWHGTDSTNTVRNNIRVSYSDDGGVAWSDMEVVSAPTDRHHYDVSITANSKGIVYLMWSSNYELNYDVLSIKYDNGIWSDIDRVTSIKGERQKVSALFDPNFNLEFSNPLFIYNNSVDGKIGFYGTWTTGTETPTMEATAVYDLPSTDYVGAFVQKEGNVEIEAYINDHLMDADLQDDEYMFIKKLDDEAPVKLRLELSRADTTNGNDDKATRILGGIA